MLLPQMTHNWKSLHPILLAREIGMRANMMPGFIIMPEMEASHLLRCTLRSVYDDKKKVGLRRHVICISPKDTTKTTVVMDFLTKMSGCTSYAGSDADRRLTTGSPKTYSTLSARTTWESMCGGYHEGSFYMPMAHDLDWMVATELFAWLGHTDNMMKSKMDQLNVALQEGRLENNLVKAKSASKKELQRFAEECVGTTVSFDVTNMMMFYDASFTFIGCTRPFTDSQYKVLNDSGFLGRCVLAEWDPSDDELFTYSIDPFGPEQAELEARLSEYNAMALRCTFGKVQYPPDRKRMLAIVGHIAFSIKQIAEKTGLKYDDLRQGRVWQQVAQLVTAHAISREVKRMYDAGVTSPHIPEIPYAPEDYEFAFQTWMKNRMSHITRRAMKISDSKTSFEQCNVDVMNTSVSQWIDEQSEPFNPQDVDVLITSKKLVDCIMATMGVKQSSAYRRIHKLIEIGYIREDSHHGHESVYSVTPKGFIAIGKTQFVADLSNGWEKNAGTLDEALMLMMSKQEIEEMQRELIEAERQHDEEMRSLSFSLSAGAQESA